MASCSSGPNLLLHLPEIVWQGVWELLSPADRLTLCRVSRQTRESVFGRAPFITRILGGGGLLGDSKLELAGASRRRGGLLSLGLDLPHCRGSRLNRAQQEAAVVECLMALMHGPPAGPMAPAPPAHAAAGSSGAAGSLQHQHSPGPPSAVSTLFLHGLTMSTEAPPLLPKAVPNLRCLSIGCTAITGPELFSSALPQLTGLHTLKLLSACLLDDEARRALSYLSALTSLTTLQLLLLPTSSVGSETVLSTMGGGGIGGGGAGANGPAGQPQADPPLPPPGTAQLALPPSLQNLTISMEGPSESQEDYWQTRLLPGIAWAGAPKLKMLSVDTEAAPLRLTEAHLLLLGMGCAQLRELHLSSVDDEGGSRSVGEGGGGGSECHGYWQLEGPEAWEALGTSFPLLESLSLALASDLHHHNHHNHLLSAEEEEADEAWRGPNGTWAAVAVPALCGLTGLRHLHLRAPPGLVLGQELSQLASSLTSLVCLAMGHSSLDQEGLDALLALSSLRRLTLRDADGLREPRWGRDWGLTYLAFTAPFVSATAPAFLPLHSLKEVRGMGSWRLDTWEVARKHMRGPRGQPPAPTAAGGQGGGAPGGAAAGAGGGGAGAGGPAAVAAAAAAAAAALWGDNEDEEEEVPWIHASPPELASMFIGEGPSSGSGAQDGGAGSSGAGSSGAGSSVNLTVFLNLTEGKPAGEVTAAGAGLGPEQERGSEGEAAAAAPTLASLGNVAGPGAAPAAGNRVPTATATFTPYESEQPPPPDSWRAANVLRRMASQPDAGPALQSMIQGLCLTVSSPAGEDMAFVTLPVLAGLCAASVFGIEDMEQGYVNRLPAEAQAVTSACALARLACLNVALNLKAPWLGSGCTCGMCDRPPPPPPQPTPPQQTLLFGLPAGPPPPMYEPAPPPVPPGGLQPFNPDAWAMGEGAGQGQQGQDQEEEEEGAQAQGEGEGQPVQQLQEDAASLQGPPQVQEEQGQQAQMPDLPQQQPPSHPQDLGQQEEIQPHQHDHWQQQNQQQEPESQEAAGQQQPAVSAADVSGPSHQPNQPPMWQQQQQIQQALRPAQEPAGKQPQKPQPRCKGLATLRIMLSGYGFEPDPEQPGPAAAPAAAPAAPAPAPAPAEAAEGAEQQAEAAAEAHPHASAAGPSTHSADQGGSGPAGPEAGACVAAGGAGTGGASRRKPALAWLLAALEPLRGSVAALAAQPPSPDSDMEVGEHVVEALGRSFGPSLAQLQLLKPCLDKTFWGALVQARTPLLPRPPAAAQAQAPTPSAAAGTSAAAMAAPSAAAGGAAAGQGQGATGSTLPPPHQQQQSQGLQGLLPKLQVLSLAHTRTGLSPTQILTFSRNTAAAEGSAPLALCIKEGNSGNGDYLGPNFAELLKMVLPSIGAPPPPATHPTPAQSKGAGQQGAEAGAGGATGGAAGAATGGLLVAEMPEGQEGGSAAAGPGPSSLPPSAAAAAASALGAPQVSTGPMLMLRDIFSAAIAVGPSQGMPQETLAAVEAGAEIIDSVLSAAGAAQGAPGAEEQPPSPAAVAAAAAAVAEAAAARAASSIGTGSGGGGASASMPPRGPLASEGPAEYQAWVNRRGLVTLEYLHEEDPESQDAEDGFGGGAAPDDGGVGAGDGGFMGMGVGGDGFQEVEVGDEEEGFEPDLPAAWEGEMDDMESDLPTHSSPSDESESEDDEYGTAAEEDGEAGSGGGAQGEHTGGAAGSSAQGAGGPGGSSGADAGAQPMDVDGAVPAGQEGEGEGQGQGQQVQDEGQGQGRSRRGSFSCTIA